MNKLLKLSICIILFILVGNVTAKTRNLSKIRSNPNFIKILQEFKKLSAKKSKEELHMIATLSLISGALETMKMMEQHLTQMVSDLLLNSNISDKLNTMPKIEQVENTLERDKSAIEILALALDLARNNITKQEYHLRVRQLARDYYAHQRQLKQKQNDIDVRERIDNLKIKILEHMDMMHRVIGDKTNATLKYLETVQGKKRRHNQSRVPQKVNITNFEIKTTEISRFEEKTPLHQKNETSEQVNDNILKEILSESIDKNLIKITRRQDVDIKSNQTLEKTNEGQKLAAQIEGNSSEDDDELEISGGGGGGGGLVGIISSLSGGEGGSDVGALFGALTGVVMNLFGPGGLDIPSLISTGTALLSGLLAGDRNFGTVLGEYVGLAFDGFSGGGGAENNGKFVGNFLGTVLAQLSADPEDEDEPPKPLIFIQNFLDSFVKAKNRDTSTDEENNRDDDGNEDNNHHYSDHGHGSNSFGFITHIVRTIVGGVTSLVLNASLGSSGGASQGSTTVLAGSSEPKGHHPH